MKRYNNNLQFVIDNHLGDLYPTLSNLSQNQEAINLEDGN